MKAIKSIAIALTSIFLTASPSWADNQDVPDTLSQKDTLNRFAGWTEEQFREYEDSIMTATYGTFKIVSSDTSNIEIFPDIVAVIPSHSHHQDTYTLDRTAAVGEIPIISGMTPSGARTYSIPISVPSGNNNHTPQLALSYNSQMGNSSLGVGWSLSGLSSITRGVKTYYYDNKAEGVKMDNTDPLFLNGVRLIQTGTSGTNILYQSEVGNIKVKAYTTNDVIRYLDVFYPEGKRARFGFENNTVNHLSYPIIYLKDLSGNTINYSYNYSENNYNISCISYNGASIEFDYENSRNDTIIYYAGGLKARNPNLLSQIRCKFGNQVFGTYSLEYRMNYELSLLKTVDYSSNNEAFNNLKFYYGNFNGDYDISFNRHQTNLGSWYSNYQNLRVVRGKLEYHSDNDAVLVFPNSNPYYAYDTLGIISNCNNTSDVIYFYSHLQENFASQTTLAKGSGFVDFLTADLTGDLKDAAIKINNYVSGNSDHLEFLLYTSNNNSDFVQSGPISFNFSTIHTNLNGDKSIQPKYYYTGDFDGDGKMEVMAISAHQPLNDTNLPSKCYIFDLQEHQLRYDGSPFIFHKVLAGETYSPEVAENNSDKIYIIDYDGDGKSDVCHIHANGASVYTFDVIDGSLVSRLVGTTSELSTGSLANRDLLPGDYNGDQKTDFILTAPDNASDTDPGYIFNSKGDGGFERNYIWYIKKHSNNSGGYYIQDVNGDGLTDIVDYYRTGFNVKIGLNNRLYQTDFDGNFVSDFPPFVPVDINAHSSNLTLLCVNFGSISTYSLPLDSRKEAMITTMSKAFGVEERNEYSLVKEQSVLPVDSLVGTEPNPSYPYVAAEKAPPVLTRSELRKGVEILNYQQYYYQGCTLHLQGLGFCGFQKATSLDSDGNYTYRTFSPCEYGVLKREVQSGKEDTRYSYTVNVQTNKLLNINLDAKIHQNYLTNLIDTTTYTYNTFGYPVLERTVYSDGNALDKQFVYENNNTYTNYYLGFVKSDITKYTRHGKSMYTERKHINSHSLCKPLRITYSKNNSTVRQEYFSYDTHGNVLSEAFWGENTADTLTTTHIYDTYGRCTRTTDPMGFSTDYTYDSHGRLSTETDHRGGVTTHQYDNFGREISVTNPDSTVITNTFEWSTEGTNGVYSITRAETGKPTVKTVYDAFNREVRSSTQRFDGYYLNTDRLYNNKGQLWKESLPFETSSPSLWKVYSYDTKDRLTSIEEPSERTTTYSYSGMSTTTTEDGIATTRTYDSLGGLTSVTDPGGTITYDLDSDGQPSSITAPGNVVTSFTYDFRRRRTAISDPSAGTTTYTYYSLSNNVKYETDANGKKKTYTYNRYGQITKVSLPEFNIWYNYNNLNELTSVYCTNGTYRYRYFTYDGHGRVKTVKDKLGNDWLKKEYFYTPGKTDSIQYSTQSGLLATEKFYYTYGNFKRNSIRYPDGTGWVYILSIDTENDLGQVTKASSGSLIREYEYDTFGIPFKRKVRLSSSYVYRQDFTYWFDYPTRNLLYRDDNKHNKYDSFEYDDLNRLIVSNSATISYDTKGNIINRSDIGSFTYSTPQKPYAISGATFLADSLLSPPQTIRYTSFHRPDSIFQGDTMAVFAYNEQYDRVKMETTMSTNSGNITVTDLYFGGCYEKHTEGNGTPIERLYLGGDYYSAPAVLIKQGNTYSLYYILRDYQGSITHVLSRDGTVLQELSYDAWGRLRNPSTLQNYLPSDEPTLLLGRGYCGHEHLQKFGLINMNARLYDPMVSRFLSPDPYVQAPDNTQNFNRYSYCLNNPLKYTDESGELFFIDDFFIGMFKGLVNGENVLESGWRQVENCAKIWGGLFTTDSNKDFGMQTWELVSRFTWQLPQTVLGFGLAHAVNTFGTIHDIDYLYGTTVISSDLTKNTGAITLGNYIIGSPYIKADPNNSTFRHEYGHYIQSQNMGPLYLLAVGAFSIGGTIFDPKNHKYQDCERDANYLAFKYFNRYVKGFYEDTYDRYIRNKNNNRGWNFESHPLLPKYEKDQYIDYQNISSLQKVIYYLPSVYVFFHL